jgi:hypothetical protein
MRPVEAVNLVNAIIYKPGWTFTAEEHTNRFEGAIKVRIDYPARNTNQDQAPEYPEEIKTYASFPLVVADCDHYSLLRRVLEVIFDIEMHEAREYFRTSPDMDAPFHPHTIAGMKRFGTMVDDLKFGIV